MRIIPEIQFRDSLLHVERPGRYIGGEYGCVKYGVEQAAIKIALCFPDLYEIGMSNNAMRILFDLFNKVDGLLCDIVFCPAPDFASVLRSDDVPLYTLTHGIPLNECDILAFSVGYELAATNILSVLELGKIPRHNDERTEDDPIVIAGGPAITNPIPFGSWIDGVHLGEAEAYHGIIQILKEMAVRKKEGATRANLLNLLQGSSFIWSEVSPESSSMTYNDFGTENSYYDEKLIYFLSPNVSVVQEHGVVEIMRGCPNGCRFCHAGEFYRPYRQKNIEKIIEEVKERINTYGYREITISSLSTGDYPYLDTLINELNKCYSHKHISFSLPSLKVNSFTLKVLQTVSTVRRSGLTFAIETPDPKWQKSVNKTVPLEDVISIIKQAKVLGWRQAKFYFMTGLPFTDLETEPEDIAVYLREIYLETHIAMNINVGTFVPKPHTPYQWVAQLEPSKALYQLKHIKSAIMHAVPRVKVNFQDPYISYIEGIITRGDDRVSKLIEHAYDHGAKFDAWDEYFTKEAWDSAIDEAGWDVSASVCKKKTVQDHLPWDTIRIGAGKGYLKNEYSLAEKHVMTTRCTDSCDHQCGACIPDISEVHDAGEENASFIPGNKLVIEEPVSFNKVVAAYGKHGKAIYYSHINIMKIMENMLLRRDIAIEFSHGFNPKPRLEFVSPLPLGIEGDEELMMVRLPATEEYESLQKVLTKCDDALPEGIELRFCALKGLGHKSLSAAFGGSQYCISSKNDILHQSISKILQRLVSVNDHITVDTRDEGQRKIYLSIYEGKGKNSNFLKCIDEYIPKYDFLSMYDVKRTRLLSKDHNSLFSYITADR